MFRLAERLKMVETEFQKLGNEFKQLKNMALKLEEENARLQSELIAVYHSAPSDDSGENDDAGAVDGQNRLENLYKEGFHVCNLHFGQFRDGECLFCMSLLQRITG